MRPTFEGVLGGFDANASPKWQIIPNGDAAIVWLNNAGGMDVTVSSPGIVKIEETPVKPQQAINGKLMKTPALVDDFRIFKLTGTMAGNTFVEVRKNKRLLEKLEVHVADIIPFTVSFNFVSDNAGHSTKRDKNTMDALLFGANEIFTSEVGIKAVKHNVRDLPFDRNLGKVVMFQNVWDIIASKRDKTAIFNIFFVWDYEQDDTPKVDNAEAAARDRVCLFEDDIGYQDWEVFVHELGHLMGLPHYDKHEFIMNSLGESGYKFTKTQVLEMRRILKRIKKLSQ